MLEGKLVVYSTSILEVKLVFCGICQKESFSFQSVARKAFCFKVLQGKASRFYCVGRKLAFVLHLKKKFVCLFILYQDFAVNN